MACFAMIGELDTTSCLALSALNDSTSSIGACEGDLDAALTLYLLKALGADFVWIANPIIHADNAVDLAHCTAPTCACQRDLSFRLMRHHESGRGVSPEVDLPDAQTASAVRLSVNAQALCCHVGLTERQAKLPACHTQVRLHIESSQRLIDSLLGTHLVLSYGDYGMSLAFAADFLDFTLTHTQYNRTGSTHELHSHNLTGSTTDLPTQTVLAGTGRARDYGCNPHTGCVIYHRRR
jgi:L-fucose isomerase-like protein